MNQLYRILLVEDESFDAELNIREIKKVLPNSTFEIVCERDTFLETLDSFVPDIIISDYNMPLFDGLLALKIAQEKCPATPFIIVTGSVNEDTAVECMKSGAADYVLKDSLKRLGSSVLNALDQQKIRKERIEAFETIRLNEAKYRYLFHNNPQPMWIYDIETLNFLEVNQAAVNHYGFTHEEFFSMTMMDIRPESEIEKFVEYLKSTGIQSYHVHQSTHKKKNGELILVEIVSYTIIHNQRNARHVLINDITERKKTEEKLLREQKLLRTLIDNLPDAIYVKDQEGKKLIANSFDIINMGVNDESEVYGKTDLEIFGGVIGERGYIDDKAVIDTGNPVLNREEDFYDDKGNLRWLLTSKIPIVEENGKVTGLVGIGRDITEQKLAQEKILKLSKGIEQSPVSIEITDTNGIIEYVNPHFSKTTGYSPEEIIGKHARVLRSDVMPSEIYSDLWDIIKSGGIWRKELINKKKDGSQFWEAVTITSIKNERGVVTNYIAIKENISERKAMEAELIKAKEKAEESDRLKSAFLANMSHEIRTPLNSIIGFSELLGDPDFDQDQKTEFIRTIVDNGNSLLSIISDIMDFSMLEAHQMKINREVFSTKKMLTDLQGDFRKKATNKGLDIRIGHLPETSDIKIESDLYRIKQVFNNLIGNSLKFTKEGYIEIGYQLNEQSIIFHVKDTGIGIPLAYHQSIFERFRQVDLEKTRKYGGNGLGLSISKNLVELLGGKIWVESEPEKYSNFFFTIPVNGLSHNTTESQIDKKL